MRKLRESEVNRIIKENSALSNEDLLHMYKVFDWENDDLVLVG